MLKLSKIRIFNIKKCQLSRLNKIITKSARIIYTIHH